jgi:hypothetical protein
VQHGFSHLHRIDQRREFVDYLVKLKSNNYADKEWYISFKKYRKTVSRFVQKLKEAYSTTLKVRELVIQAYEEENEEEGEITEDLNVDRIKD